MLGLKRYQVIAISIAIALMFPIFALAQSGIPTTIVPQDCSGPDCSCAHLIKLAQNILNSGIFISVFMSAIIFAWEGWWFMTGRNIGNSGYIEYAKNVTWNVVIGLVIILAAYLIVDTLMKTLTTIPIWTSICS